MSLRSNGSYIGPRPAGPTNGGSGVASGIWDLRTAQRQRAANAWPFFEATDPDFANVSLLLHMDGSNGSTTFTNSANTAATVAARGSAEIQTSEKQFGTGALYVANTGNDGLTISNPGSLFSFTGDFVIEMWLYPISLASDSSLYVITPDNTNYLAFNLDSTNFSLYLNSGGVNATIAHGLSLNQWSHIAFARSGTTVRAYVSGVLKGSVTKSGTVGYSSTTLHRIGSANSASYRIDDYRITKGSDRGYTGSTITVPTAAFPDA